MTADDIVPTGVWSRERRTAIHEAGHAVVAKLLGRPFTTITVEEDDDSLGSVTHAAPGDWFRPDVEINARIRLRAEQHIMICLAGAEAETLWSERVEGAVPDWADLVQEGAAHDYRAAADLGDHLSGSPDETTALLEWLRLRSRNTIVGQAWIAWPMVERLADAVTVHRTLSWRRAAATMQTAADDVLRMRRSSNAIFDSRSTK